MYNLSNLEAKFKSFLLSGNISRVSVRNYLSDIRHVLGWANNNQIKSELDFLTSETLLSYRDYLIQSKLPVKTINRRLSSVRKLCTFMRIEGVITTFPESVLTNIALNSNKEILNIYKKELEANHGDKRAIIFDLNTMTDLFKHC